MLLDDFVCNVKILTVLKLSWEYSNADAPPRNFHALSFRTVGNAHYTMSGSEFTVKNGDLLFVPQNVGYHITAQQEELYVIHFELPEKTQSHLELFHIDSVKIRTLFETCYKVWTEKKPDYYFKSLSIFYNILGLIAASATNMYANNTNQKIKPAIDYLHANYTDSSLSVLTLCDIVQLSDTWFRKLFTKYYGVKPVKYINTLRINYAKELLESGYYKVEDVAIMAGFEDTKYFSTIFRQYTGVSPSRFKNNKTSSCAG